MFPTFLDKLRAIYYPPGWFPGVDVEPFFHWFTLVNHKEGVPNVMFKNWSFLIRTIFRLNIRLLNTTHHSSCGLKSIVLRIFFYSYAYLCILNTTETIQAMWTLHSKLHFLLSQCNALVAFLIFGKPVIFCNHFSFFSWYAPHLEVFRGVGVIGYYVAKLLDKDGILPNRIFMISFFGLSTILWIVYAIRSVSFWANVNFKNVLSLAS